MGRDVSLQQVHLCPSGKGCFSLVHNPIPPHREVIFLASLQLGKLSYFQRIRVIGIGRLLSLVRIDVPCNVIYKPTLDVSIPMGYEEKIAGQVRYSVRTQEVRYWSIFAFPNDVSRWNRALGCWII